MPIVHAHCHTSGAKQNFAQEKTVSGMFRQQCVSDSDAQHCSPFHVSFVDWFVPVSDAEEIVSFHTCRCFGSLYSSVPAVALPGLSSAAVVRRRSS